MGSVLVCFAMKERVRISLHGRLTHLDMSMKGTSSGTYFLQYQNTEGNTDFAPWGEP